MKIGNNSIINFPFRIKDKRIALIKFLLIIALALFLVSIFFPVLAQNFKIDPKIQNTDNEIIKMSEEKEPIQGKWNKTENQSETCGLLKLESV